MKLAIRPACTRCGVPAFDRCDICDRWLCLTCGRLGPALPVLTFICRSARACATRPADTAHHVRV